MQTNAPHCHIFKRHPLFVVVVVVKNAAAFFGKHTSSTFVGA